MNLQEKIKIISNLQKISIDIFNAILSLLKIGMSEIDISSLIKIEFEKRGIAEYWYNVPIGVWIGIERFKVCNTTTDYNLKNPSKDSKLFTGAPVLIDLSPMDSETKLWGDWSSTFVFQPRKIDDEQVKFLKTMRQIQRKGIERITTQTTGREIADYYLNEFKKNNIQLLDVRNNVGHSLHEGPKDQAKRIWLDQKNNLSLGSGFYAVEPGGITQINGKEVVARFEDAIYIPKEGTAIILGNKELMPFAV